METSINSLSEGRLQPAQFAEHLISCKREYSVTRVSYITGFSRVDLPVAIAYRPNSKVLSQSGGKGVSKVQALISALMESYECDAAEKIQPDTYSVSFEELVDSSISALDPRTLPTTLTDYSSVSRIDWSECYDLFSNETIMVPFDAISLDFTRMSDLGRKCFMQLTSNGLASGQDVESAIISALLEIIERHSVTTAEINNTSEAMEIDLTTLPSSISKQLLSKFDTASVSCKLFYVGIFSCLPVYSCLIVDNDGQGNVGWGCHTDDDIAAARAITEANQARTIQISGSREDMHRYDYIMVHKINHDLPSAPENLTSYSDLKKQHFHPSEINLRRLADIWADLGLPNPLVKVLASDKYKAAVRVVVPLLHGYNYPAYRSVLRNNYTDQLSDYLSKVTHRPAAI
jgi:ribosomal protein S12 methylthiotransferase accessory factor